jgi:hypothetical protein
MLIFLRVCIQAYKILYEEQEQKWKEYKESLVILKSKFQNPFKSLVAEIQDGD